MSTEMASKQDQYIQKTQTHVGETEGEPDGSSLDAIEGIAEGFAVGDLLGIFVGCNRVTNEQM